MSKGKASTEAADLVKPASQAVTELTAQARGFAGMSSRDQLKALESVLGLDSADVEVIAAGTLPFWPALAGAVLVGTIQGRREVATKWKTPKNPEGTVGLYTVRIEDRACLAATLDGEVFELQPGDNITVLERQVMKELRARSGQKVAILCLGKKEGKEFSYWDYKILGKKRTAEEISAANMQAMTSLQAKQLEPGNGAE